MSPTRRHSVLTPSPTPHDSTSFHFILSFALHIHLPCAPFFHFTTFNYLCISLPCSTLLLYSTPFSFSFLFCVPLLQGKCFRLYTERSFTDELQAQTYPEILRSRYFPLYFTILYCTELYCTILYCPIMC